jgi:hypothetical protein
MLAENQNLTSRKKISNLARGFETVEPRHTHVHHDQVWFELASFFESILTINGFGAHFPTLLVAKK